jgi:hypothetical protein
VAAVGWYTPERIAGDDDAPGFTRGYIERAEAERTANR